MYIISPLLIAYYHRKKCPFGMDSSVNHTVASVQQASEMVPVAQQTESSSKTLQIYSSSPNTSMLLDIEKPLPRINSLNQERVLKAQNQRAQKLPSMLQREICVEDICFHANREKMLPDEHKEHSTVKYSELMQKLNILQCNRHLAEENQQQAIDLLDAIDRIYNAIVDFQDEIIRLFQQIKQDALNHITTVKQSFYSTHHDRICKQLHNCFDYASVKHALAEIERFKMVEYPNLDYPWFKVCSMQKRIGLASVNNKLIGIQAVNSWIQRLYALDKRDRRVIYNRSIASFLNKSPCEKPLFSYYLKDTDYSVTNNGKTLKRTQCRNENVPFAVIEKEMLTGAEIKFKVINMGKGMFIGISPLEAVQAKKSSSKKPYQNLVFQSGSYYLTNRGDVLPEDKKRHLSRMEFTTGDEIILKRERNTIFWMRKRQEKIEQVKITLSITEYSQALYPCVHMVDGSCILELID